MYALAAVFERKNTMDTNRLYEEWLAKAGEDKDLIDELESIKGNESEIYERFYRELRFGTAGLRGVIGAGTNRMNIYTVRRATQGLANYLNKKLFQRNKRVASATFLIFFERKSPYPL